MANYEITAPNGKKYRVSGQGSADDALRYLKSHLDGSGQSEFDAKAASLNQQQLEFARVTDDSAFGDYLRNQAKAPKPGETRDETDARLYGAPMQDELGAISGPLSFASGAADMLAWGAGDEASAAVISATTGKPYDQVLQQQRDTARALAARNPNSYLGGQVAGAVLPAVLTMGGSTGGTLAGNTVRGGMSGVGQGMLYGFNSGEGNVQDRLNNAVNSGVVTGVLGAAGPVLGKGIGGAWNGVGNWLASRGVDGKAGATLVDMLSKSGLTPQQALAKLDELGPEAMLADLAQIEAAGTARASSEAGELMGGRLAQRREAGAVRMGDALDQAFGPAQDPYLVQQGTRAAKEGINPAYRSAIQNAPPLPRNLDDAIAQGLTFPTRGLSLENRQTMGKIMTSVDDALMADTPQESASRLLDLRKTLDAQIAYDGRSIAMMSSADKATQGVLRQARGVVDDLLKKHIPGIAEADAAHAPLSRQQAAYDFGRKELLRGGTNAVTPAEAQARLGRMTPVEQQMTGQGVRSELDRILSNTRRDPGSTIDRITSRDWNGEKLEGLLGPSASQRLTKAIERENLFTDTSRLVEPSQGSRTAVLEAAKDRWTPRQGLLSQLAADVVAGGAGSMWTGDWRGGVYGIAARRLGAKMISRSGRPSEKVITKIADALTSSGAKRDEVARGLLGIAQSFLTRKQKAAQIEHYISGLLQSNVRSVPAHYSPTNGR